MTDIGDAIPEDKREAVKAAVSTHFIDEFKLQFAAQQTRTQANGDRQQMREAMTAIQDKREKLTKTTNAKAKDILNDKKALKAFKKILAEMTPQPRGGGGRGQGGGGGGGGGR